MAPSDVFEIVRKLTRDELIAILRAVHLCPRCGGVGTVEMGEWMRMSCAKCHEAGYVFRTGTISEARR